MEPAEVYRQLLRVFIEQPAGLLHPEFPRELIRARFALLTRQAFYCSGNYLAQIVAEPEGITIHKLVRIGRVRPAEMAAFFALACRLGEALGLPARMEDPTGRTLAYYHDLAEVHAEGGYFFVHNPAAHDALDTWQPEASFADPFESFYVPGFGRVRVGPFATAVHLDPGCRDPLPRLLRLCSRTRVVSVSASRAFDVEAVRRALLPLRDLFVSGTEAYYECSIRDERLQAYARFGARRPTALKLLVAGRWYDVDH